MKRKIPLAWLQLTREKVRLTVAISGIVFADILMFMQLGFMNALFETAITIHRQLRGDLVLISPESVNLINMESFSRRRLFQASGFRGVQSVNPLYIGLGNWKNPQTNVTRGIQIFAFDPARPAFNISALNKHLNTIKLPNVFLFDEASRPEFGPVAEILKQGNTVTTEVNGHRIKIGGLVKIGLSFALDGNLFTSDLNLVRLFDNRSINEVDVGLITLTPDANAKEVQKRLAANLPKDVRVLTMAEFIKFEQEYWKNSTAIGFIFSLGVGMGFIVGIVIVYQILYTDVADHLAEYATLKAMGYTDLYLLQVVFQEALILSILGYFPGLAISWVLYGLTAKATFLPIAMTITNALLVLSLTVLMCTMSGAIAVRKLRAADPADIF